jgi:membrane-associated phospholipid phosphatase
MTFINKLISYTLHPIIFPTIGTLFYFILSPQYFTGSQKNIILLLVFLSTYLIPLLMLLFLKKFNLIDSYQLETIHERKSPIIFLLVLSLMMGRLLLNTRIAAPLAYSFFGGSFALLVIYLLFFKEIKTSLHTLGIGSLIGFVMVLSIEFQINYTLLIAILFILFGFIATSRLFLKAHKPLEVYIGLLLGIVTQFMSYYFL